MNYFKILRFLEHGNRTVFSFPIEEQMAYLDLLGEPTDDIDRGYKQYLCQNQLVRPRCKLLLFNIVGVLGLPFMLIYFLLKRLFTQRGWHIDCLIEKKGMPEVIPTEIREQYQPSENYEVGLSLGIKDLKFVWLLIFRAPFHPYFVFKAMMNVARYSNLIYRYTPKTMIQFGEFSFSCSILTAYCHRHSIKHIDIMHGEKLFNIRDAFFHYDECYVWDEYYANLFCGLKAEPNQFKVAIPESLIINVSACTNEKMYVDYKYYLAIFSEEQIKEIVSSMSFVKRKGKTVKFRPHPRYSDIALLKKYVDDWEIEDPKEVGILESISNVEYVVGSFSTVLTQAFFSGKTIILDDVTFASEFYKLKELKYFLSSKDTLKLSELQS